MYSDIFYIYIHTRTRMNEPINDSKPVRDKHSEDKAGREGLSKAGIFKQRSN